MSENKDNNINENNKEKCESNYYKYDDFFKQYLENNEITQEDFYKYSKEQQNPIYLKSQQEYKTNYPEDYKIELEIRREKYKKEQEDIQKAKEEYNKIKKEETIKMVMRQTDYDYDTAKQHLENNNYNYLEIIQNYISGGKTNHQTNQNTKSVNQQIYSHLRSFMRHQKESQ